MGRDKEEKEMTIFEHLDELRTRIIIVLLAVAVCSVAGWFIGPYVLDFLINKVGEVQILRPTDALKIRLVLSCWVGLGIASPVLLTEIWLFVAPGLYSHEKKFVFPAIFVSFLLFLAGGAFALYLLPYTLRFLEQFVTENMRPDYQLEYFINFCAKFIFAFAFVFQIPIILVGLSQLGVVSYRTLAANRKYALLIGLIIGALLTPADPASMVFLAAPLYLLFEASLLIIRFTNPGTKPDDETETSEDED